MVIESNFKSIWIWEFKTHNFRSRGQQNLMGWVQGIRKTQEHKWSLLGVELEQIKGVQ